MELQEQEKFLNRYRVPSIRLKNWDYSSSAYYFITICTKDRIHYFGGIKNETMHLSIIGKIVNRYWSEIPNHFPFVRLDVYTIMPNHIHGIIIIDKTMETTRGTDYINVCDTSVETHNHASLRKNIPTQNYNYTPQYYTCRHYNRFGPQSKNLASIIRGFKGAVKKYAMMHNIPFSWQGRFYEHIIKDETYLNAIQQYIIDNPKNWNADRNNTNKPL